MSDRTDKNATRQFSDETVKQFLALQNTELEVRKKELENQDKNSGNQKEVALKTIEAQQNDRESARRNEQLQFYVIAGCLLFAMIFLCSVLVYLIKSDHADIALEVGKFLASVGLGFAGGWGWAKSKNST